LLWISGQYAIDVHQLSASETATVALSCESSPPAYVAVVDGKGDLWIGSQQAILHEWTPAEQADSCMAGPAFGGVDSFATINSMAFDAQGNLWVANFNDVAGFPSASLAPGGGGIQPKWGVSWNDGCDSPYFCDVDGLAFDSAGNLWAKVETTDTSVSASLVFEFSKTQLENLPEDPAPRPLSTLSADGDWDGGHVYLGAIAFDAEGNLWAGAENGAGSFLYRFPAATLVEGGAPDLQVSVPGRSYLSLAFSPIPPGLPIYP